MKGKHIIATFTIIIFLFTNLNISSAFADEINDNSRVKSAFGWLVDNQNDDGTWGDNLKQLSTYEVLNVLQGESDYSTSYGKGVKWAKEIQESTTDYLSRQLLIKDLVTKEKFDSLLKTQNEDGGFGLTDLYESDILDSNLVLLSLLSQKEQNSEVENKIINYLINNQNEDGSFSYLNGGDGNVKLTAEVVITLVKLNNVNNNSVIQEIILKSINYLYSQQKENNLWGDSLEDIRTSLMVFEAILEVKGVQESSAIKDSVDKLQLDNGSIMNDAYATALYIKLYKELLEIPQGNIDSIKLYKDNNGEKELTDIFTAFDKMSIEVEGNYDEDKTEFNKYIMDEDGGVVYQDNNLTSNWDINKQKPGSYSVIVQILDSKSNYVICSEKKDFIIEEGKNVTRFDLLLDSDSTIVNEPIDVNVKVNFDYLANVNEVVTLKTKVTKNDNLINEDVKEQELNMNQENYDINLLQFTPDVSEVGVYIIKTEAYINDSLVDESDSKFTVYNKQPNTGIYITQDKDKDKLYPGKDKLNANFHLKGLGQGSSNEVNILESIPFNALATFALNAENDIEELEFTYSNNIMGNKYIEFFLNGGYTIGTKEGNPDSTSDNNKVLLFGHSGNSTSYATVSVDGSKYNYSANAQAAAADLSDGSVTTVGRFNNVKVTQKFRIVNNDNTGRDDIIEMSYTVKNEDTISHDAGLRIMMDTMLGSNDSAPFRVPGIGALSYEKELSQDKIPQYWQAFDSLSNPQVVAQGTFYREGMIKPDLVQFMNWRRVSNNNWYLTPTGGGTGDSAVTIFWNPTVLQPGEEREYKTYYGIGELNSDIRGSLVASITGAAKLEATDIGYNPNPFLVTAYAYNMGFDALENVKARIILPAGLKLEKGEVDSHELGNIAIGAEVQTSWNIVAEDSLVDKNLTYSVVYSVNGVDVKTVNRSVFVPQCINNVAGRDVVLETTIPNSKLNLNEANITPSPAEVINNEDGSKTLRWKFEKVNINESIDFNIQLNGENLLSEEKYIVTKNTSLSYTNNNNEREIRNLKNMRIEVDKYALDSQISTNKLEYISYETVNIKDITKNLHDYPMNLTGNVTVYDSNNNIVEIINNRYEATWEGNEEKNFNFEFDTKTYEAGTYTVRIQWLEGTKEINTSYTTFKINKDGEIINEVSTDKEQYNSNETVRYTNLISNTSSNIIESNLSLKTVIINEQGEIMKEDNISLEDILSLSQVSKKGIFDVKDNNAGRYIVKTEIYSNNEKISESSAVFTVLSSEDNLQGLKGTLDVPVKTITPKQEVSINSTVQNLGNKDLLSLPQIIKIIQVGTQKVVKEFSWQSDVAKAGVNNKDFKWGDETLLEKGDYIIQYEAITPDGKTLLLASNNFAVDYISDDFDSESDMWNYMGSAHRSSKGYSVLTHNENNQSGAMWLKKGISAPFVTKFRYMTGGGNGADGFTLMFHKKANKLGGIGRELGFKEGNGYAIEFDSFYNAYHGETTSIQRKHIALYKDKISSANPGEIIQPLALNVEEKFANKISDNKWHDVEVAVGKDYVEVYVDGEKAISYKGEIDTEFDGFGFSAATGTSNDNQYIDDIKIYENTEVKKESIKDDFSAKNDLWTCMGNSYVDENEGYLVLTNNSESQKGAAWLNNIPSQNYNVEFKYKAGGGTGGEGLVFMFNKERYKLGEGDYKLGFDQGNGYGLEFDSYYNSSFGENVSLANKSHIALCKDKIASSNKGTIINSLASNSEEEVRHKLNDNQWHNVQVKVREKGIEVILDGEKVLSYTGKIDKSYSGIGFCAANSSKTDYHLIDDVVITEDID